MTPLKQLQLNMLAVISSIEDEATQRELHEAVRLAGLAIVERKPDAVLKLAVLCWQASLPIQAISDYLKWYDADNDQLELTVKALNHIDQAREIIWGFAAPNANGITAPEGKQAYEIVMSMWHMSRAAISMMTKDGQATELMRQSMYHLVGLHTDLGFRFPPNE